MMHPTPSIPTEAMSGKGWNLAFLMPVGVAIVSWGVIFGVRSRPTGRISR